MPAAIRPVITVKEPRSRVNETRETRETRPDDVSHNPEVVGSNPTPATTKALVAAIQGHAGSGSLGHLIGAARVLSPQPVEDENRA